MKVLVTGASGFVGSWLVERLMAEGHEVRTLQRSRESVSRSKAEVYVGDVTDFESLKPAIKGAQVIFHLAGLVAYSRSEREAMDRVNVQGTENVVKASILHGVQRLVHFSSVAAIGASFDQKPLNEGSAYNLQRLNLGYFESKRKAEEIVRQAVERKELEAVIVNPSTIYGPGDMKKPSRKTQAKVALGQFPFYTGGGVSVVGIENLMDAVIAAWKKGRSGQRYILSGENITIQKLFQLIAEAAGVKPPSIFLPNFVSVGLGWAGDLARGQGLSKLPSYEQARAATLYHWFDSTLAQHELGLKIEPARTAIESSVQWFLANKGNL